MSCDHKSVPPCLLPAITRRRFLKQTAITSAAVAALPACEFAESFVQGQAFEFDINSATFDALQTVGQAVAFDAGEGETALKVILVRVSDDEVAAFDRICPHANLDMDPELAAPLGNEWLQEEQQLKCGWHNSKFDINGDVVPGSPSADGINRYKVEFDPATGVGQCDTSEVV